MFLKFEWFLVWFRFIWKYIFKFGFSPCSCVKLYINKFTWHIIIRIVKVIVDRFSVDYTQPTTCEFVTCYYWVFGFIAVARRIFDLNFFVYFIHVRLCLKNGWGDLVSLVYDSFGTTYYRRPLAIYYILITGVDCRRDFYLGGVFYFIFNTFVTHK